MQAGGWRSPLFPLTAPRLLILSPFSLLFSRINNQSPFLLYIVSHFGHHFPLSLYEFYSVFRSKTDSLLMPSSETRFLLLRPVRCRRVAGVLHCSTSLPRGC